MKRDKYTCQYCLVKFESRDLTIDHVVPISKGGPTVDWNLVTACKQCNSEKSNKFTWQM